MTGSIRIFEKSNFTPKLSVLVFLKVKLPDMTDWHITEVTVRSPFITYSSQNPWNFLYMEVIMIEEEKC